MAENETAVQEQEQAAEDFAYPVTVEDAGPGAKRVKIEIPADRIASKLDESFSELRKEAALPGFRPGHAPRKLIEKRFNEDVRDQVRRSLISESYQQALEKNSLQVIGEPEFDDPESIKLPAEGALSYSFQVEIQPKIDLPDLKGLKIRKPKIEIKDENIDQAMQNLREQQGTLVPVEDRGVNAKDFVVADIRVLVDDAEIASQQDAQLVARPGRLAGIQIDDLDNQLEGTRAGETRDLSAPIPETHPNESARGKTAKVQVTVKDIKRMELPEVNEEFLEDLGFENEQELREALREQMDEKIKHDVQQNMREQVLKFLNDTVQVELPSKLSDRQSDRVVSRRAVNLMMRGVPREQVEANLERLRHGAKEEAIQELKSFFILQQIASNLEVDVDEAELNGRVATIAIQRGERPERLKQEMAKDNSLANLYIQMRENKALDKILEQAEVEEVDRSATEAAGEAPAAQ